MTGSADNVVPLFGEPNATPEPAPLSNARLEQAFLGSVLANNKTFHACSEFLRPEHFADPAHSSIYAACARRIINGGVGDVVTMSIDLANSTIVAEAGGTVYLASLLTAMMPPSAAAEYGRMIHELWQRRSAIEAAEALAQAVRNVETPIAVAINAHAADLDRMFAASSTTRRLVDFNEVIDATIADAEAAARGDKRRAVLTGMQAVDDALGGLRCGAMTLLAGRPGAGKSALGFQWAANVARRARDLRVAGADIADIPGVAALSLEMPREDVARRLLSGLSGVSASRIARGAVAQDQWAHLASAQREMRDLPLTIEDTGGLTVQQIRAAIRRIKRRHGLGMIVLDHLHIVRPEAHETKNGGTYAVEQVSAAMVAIAKEFDVPVLCLAQLNRQLMARDDKRPNAGDLRQSGSLEQDADTILFVHRPEMYLGKSQPEQKDGEADDKYAARVTQWEDAKRRSAGKAELIIEKNRHGSTGALLLNFHGPTMSFTEPDRPQSPDDMGDEMP